MIVNYIQYEMHKHVDETIFTHYKTEACNYYAKMHKVEGGLNNKNWRNYLINMRTSGVWADPTAIQVY